MFIIGSHSDGLKFEAALSNEVWLPWQAKVMVHGDPKGFLEDWRRE
jgi:hypothetical protein